jgi:hypothetical protein
MNDAFDKPVRPACPGPRCPGPAVLYFARDTLARGSRSTLPDEQQGEFVRVLLQLGGHEQPVYVLTPEEEVDLGASIASSAAISRPTGKCSPSGRSMPVENPLRRTRRPAARR